MFTFIEKVLEKKYTAFFKKIPHLLNDPQRSVIKNTKYHIAMCKKKKSLGQLHEKM